ncbi:hypothetical protein MBLNU230_g5220t1 [Neophaeotheca triangularis]
MDSLIPALEGLSVESSGDSANKQTATNRSENTSGTAISTDKPTSAPPIQRILNTYELSEAILLQFGIRDLLNARNVCTALRNVIDTSTPLKKRLFLTRDDAEGPTWQALEDCGAMAPGSTKLLQEQVVGLPELGHGRTMRCNTILLSPKINRYLLFSCVTKFRELLSRIPIEASVLQSRLLAENLQDSIFASMYLTSPPVTRIAYHFNALVAISGSGSGEPHSDVHGEVINSDGLKWQDLVHAIKLAMKDRAFSGSYEGHLMVEGFGFEPDVLARGGAGAVP